ncbi:MAG TPA: MarR family transcriptional regulator [Marmoricola sp.]|nr:MarR family transcriptional regulator [Marmoricola sp.]
MPVHPARVEDQLCFALYAASRAVAAAYRPLLRELDLTYPQYLVMLCLWESDSMTVTDIGRTLGLDSGTLSPLLQRLSAAGLVRRERQADDERVVRIHLTGEGRAIEEKAGLVREQVEGSTGLTGKEFAGLRTSLHALTATISGTA